MQKKYPEYLVKAVSGDRYEPRPERMSVTRLIGPPMQRTLEMLHYDDIVEQVEDKLWALDGIGFDHIMKKHSQWGLTNIKLEVPFPTHKLTVVAKLDYYDVLNHILADLKRTSVWSIKDALAHGKPDWNNQLNVYDRLLYQIAPQLEVHGLQIHAYARDWRPVEKLRYNDYPDKMEVIEIPRWTREQQMDYIDTQLQEHIQHPERECTPEEKWQKKDTYAVMKKNRKSAMRVLDSEKEANDWKAAKGGDEVVKRPGGCIRCESYCNVSEFCKYSK